MEEQKLNYTGFLLLECIDNDDDYYIDYFYYEVPIRLFKNQQESLHELYNTIKNLKNGFTLYGILNEGQSFKSIYKNLNLHLFKNPEDIQKKLLEIKTQLNIK